MAESPSHTFGQHIGDILEVAVEPILTELSSRYGLYLDKKGPRPARPGNKVTWIDVFGNSHDLDFVFERGGTRARIGTPLGFVEVAWRRYTKHSRNKAQEIQGAIQPLVITHNNLAPFFGVILAGVFTKGSLDQLMSLGFKVLYFPYTTIVDAFKEMKIDAYYDEDTPDSDFVPRNRKLTEMGEEGRKKVAKRLIELNRTNVSHFVTQLERCITREIEFIGILPLFGSEMKFISIEKAIESILECSEDCQKKSLIRFEIEVVYNNGDKIRGQFHRKDEAIQFLQGYLTSPLKPLVRNL